MSLYTSVMVRIHGSHKPFTKRGDIRCNISMPQNESGAGKQARRPGPAKLETQVCLPMMCKLDLR